MIITKRHLKTNEEVQMVQWFKYHHNDDDIWKFLDNSKYAKLDIVDTAWEAGVGRPYIISIEIQESIDRKVTVHDREYICRNKKGELFVESEYEVETSYIGTCIENLTLCATDSKGNVHTCMYEVDVETVRVYSHTEDNIDHISFTDKNGFHRDRLLTDNDTITIRDMVIYPKDI